MRVSGVVLVGTSGDETTWRILLSCGHEARYVSRAKLPVRGMPRHKIYPCFLCLSAKISGTGSIVASAPGSDITEGGGKPGST